MEKLMIKIEKCTVFDLQCDALVNTTNILGYMGKGLALEFALRYPEMAEEYKRKADSNEIRIGEVSYFAYEDKLIVNFPTKIDFRYPSKIEWIEMGLKSFVSEYKNLRIKCVCFPKLGCSNGGLEWHEVKPIMMKYLNGLDIDVYICEDTNSEAIGKEKEMVDAFNDTDFDSFHFNFRLNTKQKNMLHISKPIKRFREIQQFDGIGISTYKSLFTYFYNLKKNNKRPEILSFDI